MHYCIIVLPPNGIFFCNTETIIKQHIPSIFKNRLTHYKYQPHFLSKLLYSFWTELLGLVLDFHNLWPPKYWRQSTSDFFPFPLKYLAYVQRTWTPEHIYWTTSSYFHLWHWSIRGQFCLPYFYSKSFPQFLLPKRDIQDQRPNLYIVMLQVLNRKQLWLWCLFNKNCAPLIIEDVDPNHQICLLGIPYQQDM